MSMNVFKNSSRSKLQVNIADKFRAKLENVKENVSCRFFLFQEENSWTIHRVSQTKRTFRMLLEPQGPWREKHSWSPRLLLAPRSLWLLFLQLHSEGAFFWDTLYIDIANSTKSDHSRFACLTGWELERKKRARVEVKAKRRKVSGIKETCHQSNPWPID